MNNSNLPDATNLQTKRKTMSFLHIVLHSNNAMIALYRIVYAYSYVIYPEGGGK